MGKYNQHNIHRVSDKYINTEIKKNTHPFFIILYADYQCLLQNNNTDHINSTFTTSLNEMLVQLGNK